jgi:hypothetical protein
MTRRIKDRTQLLAFLTALVLSRLAVTPLYFRTSASGAFIEPRAFLALPAAAVTSALAAGLVYYLEARYCNDPCVRRHRFWDMGGIVGFMVLLESNRALFSASPLWVQLALMIAGMAAISFGKSLLRRRLCS